ncbi:unnamed protein product, partial [Didymodactylos carnosus]
TGKSKTIAGIILKILPKLRSKQKILVCAPSNNACDELMRRILDQFVEQNIDYDAGQYRKDWKQKKESLKMFYDLGSVIRVASQPPDDHRLCDHFFDFMVMCEVVDMIKSRGYVTTNEVRKAENYIIKRAKVIISTLNYCASARLHQLNGKVAFVIIDEATQSLEADSLLPFRFGCAKILLVGDPLQLPPTVLSDAGKEYNLSQSLYTRLYERFFSTEPINKLPITMLETQYRMYEDICRFPSQLFYNNRLLTDPSIQQNYEHFPLKPLYYYNITLSKHTYDDASSAFNLTEEDIIRHFSTQLVSYFYSLRTQDDEQDNVVTELDYELISNVSTSSNSLDDILQPPTIDGSNPIVIDICKRIAVITPYRAQVRRLKECLSPYIEVGTVDGFQGKEKDIVLISCVRSNMAQNAIGFLNDMKRLNVMLTRSKYALYIFGNFTQFSQLHEGWKQLVDDAKHRNIIEDIQAFLPTLPLK